MIGNDRYIIIFSGYNQRAVIAFLRTLEKNRIDNYIIIAKSEDDDILLTKYSKKVAVIRKEKKLDIKEILALIAKLKKNYGFIEFLIAPTTEALNRFFIQYREDFYKLGAMDCLVDGKLYQMISDKKEFGDICSAEKITVPKEIEFPQEFYKPFVAKPIRYSNSKGEIFSPVIVKNEVDFKLFQINYSKDDFYYQEYVEGRSIYLLYYITRDKTIFKFSQENLAQQPGGKSIVIAKTEKYHEAELSESFEKLFLKMNYFGFVMVEIRCCSDMAYMIEANPRFWGPSQLFVDAGYNFFEFFLKEYGFLSVVRMEDVDYDVTYYWHNGIEMIPDKNSIIYFNDFKKMYCSKIAELLECDIYRREDTMQLFLIKK